MRRKNDDVLVAALAEVEDPVLFVTLGALSSVRGIRVHGSDVEVRVAVAVEPYPARDELRRRMESALGGGARVRLELEVLNEQEKSDLGVKLLELVGTTPSTRTPGGHGENRSNPFARNRSKTRVLAISSGKGGVGKSSVTVNLSIALARIGRSVALLDADIYGFSVPRMIGVRYPPLVLGRTIVPPVAYGVRCCSMGFFVDEDKAVAWRGPMLDGALEQFLVDVYWGVPDFLLVDMPPGTGDIALSVAQQLPLAEFYIVTTPQSAAKRVAQRAGAFARQLRLPIRGVIENMSYFETPDKVRHELFGAGGGAALAESLGVPLLGQVPLVQKVREGADEGLPAAIIDPGGSVEAVFEEIARAIDDALPPRVYRSELRIS